MIKAVIFDLWKTLGEKHISFSGEFCKRFGLRKTFAFMPRYEASVQLKKWKTVEQMAEGMLQYFELPVTKDNVQFIANLLTRGEKGSSLYPGMKTLLSDIHRTCRLAVLSNTTVFETHFLREWGVENMFDAVVYSWQINSLKPAEANFRAVVAELRVKPSECVFVDDTRKNRVAARAFGMHAIDAGDTDLLRKRLRRLGVKL